MGEAQENTGERQRAKLGKAPSRLNAVQKRLKYTVEWSALETKEHHLLKDGKGFFEEITWQAALEVAVAEVEAKKEPEGGAPEEKQQTVLRWVLEHFAEQKLVEKELGTLSEEGAKPEAVNWLEGEFEDWNVELKGGGKGAKHIEGGGIELGAHISYKLKNLPLEAQITPITAALEYDREKRELKFEWPHAELELAFSSPWPLADFETENFKAEGVKIEGKVTFKFVPNTKEVLKKLWGRARPVLEQQWKNLKQQAPKAWEQIEQRGGTAMRALGTWAEDNLTLVISEDGELVAAPALDLLLAVTTVVLVVVALAAIIVELKLESDLDGADAERKRRADELASFYVKGLQGEHLDALSQWEQNQAFQAGKNQREKLLQQHGDGFDEWLANNEADVVAEAKKQFRIVVADALWAGFAQDNSFAADQFNAWMVLYGRDTDPYTLKKMDLFLRYGKDAHRPPAHWETGQWQRYNVGQEFNERTV
jgi:hypothetical protein